MALSKSQIKKIDKYGEQYYIILPFFDTNSKAICDYFGNVNSKFRYSKDFVYYIISNNEMKDVNKYIRHNPHVYKTENKYANKQEVFDDIKKEKIYITNLDPIGEIKGMYKVKI